MIDEVDHIMDCLCCAGEGHTIKEGGGHVNLIQLRKLAEWPYLVALNFMVPESADHPLACAVVCDKCLAANKEARYALAGGPGENGSRYYRVPIDDLEDPEFYWPDHHPDNLKILETTGPKGIKVIRQGAPHGSRRTNNDSRRHFGSRGLLRMLPPVRTRRRDDRY